MLRLKKSTLDWALNHVVTFGDTDVLPIPFEFKAIEFDWDNVRDTLASLDMSAWLIRPQRALLAPKLRYAFRIVTQLDPLDFIVFASLIREIADDLEASRIPKGKRTVFSYRVDVASDGQLFGKAVGYEQFRNRAEHLLSRDSAITHVAVTDIADFYPRIYHHRLENALRSATGKSAHVSAIMRLLSGWNETESFGIPVGNQPSRLLAETALNDVDEALLAAGFTFVRYNDDFRVFAESHDEAYQSLAFLADILYRNHGLTLQPQKTFVLPADEFAERFLASPEEKEADSLGERFERLVEELGLSGRYDPIEYDDLNEEQQALIDSLNLSGLFEDELNKEEPDFANLRFVLSRLGQLGDAAVAETAISRLDILYPIFPEIVGYLSKLRNLDPSAYRRIGRRLLGALENSILSELEYHRMWGLHLFSESTDWNCPQRFFKLLSSARDQVTRRKLILAMGRAGQRHWFQSQWRNLFNEPPWTRRALLAGASCLTSDARKHWYRSVAPRLDLLETAVMKWARANPFSAE